jgi:hypothetical protein
LGFQNEYNEVIDIGKMRKNSENTERKCFFWIRAPAAIFPAESANCMQNRAGCNTAERS